MTFEKNMIKALNAVALVLVVSCGKGGGSNGSSSSVANPACVEALNLFKSTQEVQDINDQDRVNEVIIGDLQWQSTDALAKGSVKSNAQATVLLRMPNKGARCTGFLINDDMIMTNNHCVANARDAEGVTATFDYTKKGKGQKYSCGEFVASNSSLDIGIVKCKGSPGKKHPKVVLADYKASVNDEIYITHQNCDYTTTPYCSPTQKVSDGLVMASSQSSVSHNADTLPGSSGSPIFDKDSHKVVAIHNAGTTYGRGMNYGVPMYRIVSYLKEKAPEVDLFSSASRAPAYQSCD